MTGTKLVEEIDLILAGGYREQEECIDALNEVRVAITKIVWPSGADRFTINPARRGNGVGPIRAAFVDAIRADTIDPTTGVPAWRSEAPFPVDTGIKRQKFGAMDASKALSDGRPFLVEWETGNVSSSHRALNKMGVGLVSGRVAGAVLVVPSAAMYRFLTDRIGNVRELRPYFPVWRALKVERGYMGILVVEHDEESSGVVFIPKGADGRARG